MEAPVLPQPVPEPLQPQQQMQPSVAYEPPPPPPQIIPRPEEISNFMQWGYKVLDCPASHDFDACPFTHVSDHYRRATSMLLNPEYCPYQKNNNGICHLGNQCHFIHGAFEMLYHPFIYKTQMCEMAQDLCKGMYCPFAHSEAELAHRVNFPRTAFPPIGGGQAPRLLLGDNIGGLPLPTDAPPAPGIMNDQEMVEFAEFLEVMLMDANDEEGDANDEEGGANDEEGDDDDV